LFAGSAAAENVSLELQWSRAIDRDDASAMWRLLPTVDATRGNEKGKTALMAAAKLGNTRLLEATLETGLALEDRSTTGGTALMYAALGNQQEMVRLILDRTKSATHYIDARSTNGWTAAMIASAKGFDSVLNTLVHGGADPWLADGYLWTPLMRAIDNRHNNVVQYLLALPDAQIDVVNENGSSALHIAALHNDLATAATLIELGANTTIRDKNGHKAFDIASRNGSENVARALQNAD